MSMANIIRKKDEVTLDMFIQKKIGRTNRLNDLSGTDWLKESVSLWFSKGLGKEHPHAQIERQHPAPFSYQDIMRLIKFFTKENEKVIDPFCGVASTLKACVLTKRVGIGIELSEKWVELGRIRLIDEVGVSPEAFTIRKSHRGGRKRSEVNINSPVEIILGDARTELPRIPKESFDYLVTSPPYWQILTKKADHKVKKERLANGFATKYSDDVRDLGNISDYRLFLRELTKCFGASYKILKNGKYASIIVSDFRHNSTYYSYHSDVIGIMEKVGFKLKGITILYQNSKGVYPYGYPYSYVPNIHHQYILNFQKLVNNEMKPTEREKNDK